MSADNPSPFPAHPQDLKRLLDSAHHAEVADWPLPPDALPWQTTIEELNVAEEELRQQNEELVQASTALESERRRYHELFDFAPDCYLVTDAHGVIREANLAAARLFRHPPERLSGRPLRVYVHPDHRFGLDLLLSRLRTGEPVQGKETLIQSREAVSVPVAVHASAERGDAGRIVGLRWLLHDLTPLKEAQDRAVQAERLAAVGQTVAALAHESRNALQRSQACLRLIALEVPDRPRVVEYVARVQKAQDDLARLFEDVRTFTAPPVLDRRPCDLRTVWRDAWNDLEASHTGVRRSLAEVIETDELTCIADSFRLGQVFRNLFDNALAAGRLEISSPNNDSFRVVIRAADFQSAGRPGAPDHRLGQWSRADGGAAAEIVRPVLHDQARRHGARPGDYPARG